ALVRDERPALVVLDVRHLDRELRALLEARARDAVDLDDELELLVEGSGRSDDGHGVSSLPAGRSSELGLDGARVLREAQHDEFGRLRGGQADAADDLAGVDGAGRVDVPRRARVDRERVYALREHQVPLRLVEDLVGHEADNAEQPAVLDACRRNVDAAWP